MSRLSADTCPLPRPRNPASGGLKGHGFLSNKPYQAKLTGRAAFTISTLPADLKATSP